MNLKQPKTAKYKRHHLLGGWTRVEMLLELYDRAILCTRGAEEALEKNDEALYAKMFVDGQKTVLAIHAGLKPDEYDIAFNIARLMNFVLTCYSEKRFADALTVLTELRSGFKAISKEATELELAGTIPAMETSADFNASV